MNISLLHLSFKFEGAADYQKIKEPQKEALYVTSLTRRWRWASLIGASTYIDTQMIEVKWRSFKATLSEHWNICNTCSSRGTRYKIHSYLFIRRFPFWIEGENQLNAVGWGRWESVELVDCLTIRKVELEKRNCKDAVLCLWYQVSSSV